MDASYSFLYPKVPEAARLLSLTGIAADLKNVLAYIALVRTVQAEGSQRFVLWDAATSAAVVAYVRCFNGGVRERLSPQILQERRPELAAAHDYFYLLRDKHIGHSVSCYEESVLRAEVEERSGTLGEILRISTTYRSVAGLNEEDLGLLEALAGFWIGWVEQEQQGEQRRVLEFLQQLPTTQLTEWRTAPEPSCLSPNAHAARRKHG